LQNISVSQLEDRHTGLPVLFMCDFGQDIRTIKYRMPIKMDSEVFIAASLLRVDLIVFHQNIRHP
ncbi:MAG: hypothetical protein WAM14_26910, partial [Candidatus Nitrosopolaris sp.]